MTTVDRDLPRSGTRPSSVLGRAAMAVLERVLPGIEEGALVLRLPDGSERRYGSGTDQVSMRIDDWRLLERIAHTPKLALGESFQAGTWRYADRHVEWDAFEEMPVVDAHRHLVWAGSVAALGSVREPEDECAVRDSR